MLTEAQKLEIDGLLALLTPTKLSKMYLRKLQKIKNTVTGKYDGRCLCAAPDRIKFYNEFLAWYKTNP